MVTGLFFIIENILKENFCRTGETDKDGIFRHTSYGNTLYIVKGNKGYAYHLYFLRENGRNRILKYSINSDGSMRNEGKASNVCLYEIDEYVQKATKYAILTPKEEYEQNQKGEYSIAKMLKWKPIEQLYNE